MKISEFSSLVFDQETYKFDQEMEYRQVFANTDYIKLCVCAESELKSEKRDNIECYLVNESGVKVTSTIARRDYGKNFVVFSLSNSMTPLPLGTYTAYVTYKVNLTDETPKHIYHTDFCIQNKTYLADTICLTYYNNRNIYNTIFVDDKGQYEKYSFRFVGSLLTREATFGTKTQVFSNQEQYSQLLSGFKKDKYPLVMGDNWGVPNGWGRKFRNALICYYCFMDGNRCSLDSEQDISRESISDSYPFFRFTATINYEKNNSDEQDLELYKYICNNNGTKLLGNIVATNQKIG